MLMWVAVPQWWRRQLSSIFCNNEFLWERLCAPHPPCRWEHLSTRHVLAKTFMVYFPANFISICRRSVDFLICTVYHLLNIRKEAQLAERWMPPDCGSLDLLPRSSLEVLDHYFTHLRHCSLTFTNTLFNSHSHPKDNFVLLVMCMFDPELCGRNNHKFTFANSRHNLYSVVAVLIWNKSLTL